MLFSVFVQSVFVFHGFPLFPKVVASLLSAVKTSMNYDVARRTLHLMKFTNRARLRRLIVKNNIALLSLVSIDHESKIL